MESRHVAGTRKRCLEREPQAVQLSADPDLPGVQALGVSFVSLGEGIDCTTPAGRLQLHVLAALAEFERGRIAERVKAGLVQARKRGTRLGRPPTRISEVDLQRTADLSVRDAAREIGISPTVLYRARTAVGLD